MTHTEIILNGKKVQINPGETILSAARREGIRIPTLCSHEALAPYGACRLCIVEVEAAGKKQILTSCTTLGTGRHEGENPHARAFKRSERPLQACCLPALLKRPLCSSLPVIWA